MEWRFLSWNLALLERSADAPQSWRPFHGEEAVRNFILDLAVDIVCFQELAQVPYVETHDLLRATTRTHSGNLAILVTHELAATDPELTVVDKTAVLATFAVAGRPPITIANVHLAPGRAGADRRLEQIAMIVDASPSRDLVIVGDTNMRLGEESVLIDGGFTGDKPPRPTWDSKRNRFRLGMPEFTAYFTRWFASPGVTVDEIDVYCDPVDFDDAHFHLSDHYALGGRIGLSQREPRP